MLGRQYRERSGAGVGITCLCGEREGPQGGTWVGEAVLVLHQGDACDGTDHCGPHELQPNIQPLHGGTGSKLAPLV